MKTIKLKLPDAWNKLSDRQLKQLAKLIYSGTRGRLFDVCVFFILMDVRWYQFRKKAKALLVLKDVTLSELKPFYDFIYNKADRTVFIPAMKVKGETLYSPAARLSNLSVDEFAMSEGLHRTWYKEKHRKALEYLAAVLYTTSPGVRPEFFRDAIEEKAKRFTRVPLAELLAMEVAYTGCKNNIADRFPVAFPKTTGKKNAGKNYGFGKVVLQMAGGKFGHHSETRKTNIFIFLEEFEENLKSAKDAKKRKP